MEKPVLIIIALIVAAVLIVLGLRFLSGNEDTWLCQNGQWVKHGNPSAPMPTKPCGSSKETTIIKVFFSNSKLDPDLPAGRQDFLCNKVFPAEREINKTQDVARAALEELLKGPTAKEKSESFLTSINEGVKIQKLSIENGVAKVDFNKQLEFQVGGSCRVAAIRTQITETLKQFPTVKNVIISINDRIEDVLQP